ncbi:lysoplasmalogenase [Microbacterium sp. CFBP9034]|uniref:lysoplasmalogenase n=1 Tax=Microbacterium sp. CFBP9034 TaxID=3096540 RepID=UPI002A6AE333|nr:lysoplasmalogenase [Microbacterium sp. CFBP9034]MDY0910060.1 lysoplasmalogenase [Microbacterium sp. CFBP9034]
MPRLWIGFAPYIVVSAVHVVALATGAEALASPTKLALMPLLALAVVWGVRGSRWTGTHTLLVAAIGLSWLGDGAGTFFPWADTVPMMLLWFGLAHLCYIWLFWRTLAVRRLPLWSAVYAVWWVVLLAVLWPNLGGLLVPVAIYGLVLGATAAGAARCHPVIAWGGVFFLASDTVLAFRLFVPDAMPDWTSPLVMLTYCLGQGLIAAGVLVAERRRQTDRAEVETPEVAV